MTKKMLGDYEILFVNDCNENTFIVNLGTRDFDESFVLDGIQDMSHIIFGDKDVWLIQDVGPLLGNADLDLEILCDIGQLASEDTDVWVAVLDHYGDHYAEGAMQALKDGDIIIWASWVEIISQWVELAEIPEHAVYYIDASSLQHDLEIEGSYTELDDGRVLEFIG